MNYSWAVWNGTTNPEALGCMEGELEAIVICDGVTLTAHGVGSESWSVRHIRHCNVTPFGQDTRSRSMALSYLLLYVARS